MGGVKPHQTTDPREPSASDRLDSWKEIAAYLKRDEKTVRRWEKSEGLPVRRHVHKTQATVYAYKAELDAWWNNRRPRLEQQEQGQATAWRSWQLRSGLVAAAAVVILFILGALNVGGWRERLFPKAAPAQIESIAVLPLENLSRDTEQEYFADGMTDALITDLAQIQGLRVISRNTVLQYKGKPKPTPQVGRDLNVDLVVEGTVLRSGSRVRITAHLIQAATDRHLWAETYERDLRDVLGLQREVATAIARQIRIRVTPEEQARLGKTRLVNPDAYEAYLRATYEDNLEKSIQGLKHTIQLDPDNGSAYADLAGRYFFLGFFGGLSPDQAFGDMEEAATKALEKDDKLADAHARLALVRLNYRWDWPASEKEFKRALELNPSQAYTHHDYGHYLMAMGRGEDSVAESKRSVELDPFDQVLVACVGWQSLYARHYDEAVQYAEKAIRIAPNNGWGRTILGWGYEQKSMFKEAIEQFQNAIPLLSEAEAMPTASLAHVLAISGRRREAEAVLTRLKERAKKSYVPALDIAVVYAGLGEKDRAFEWLERAYEERSGRLVYIKGDPRLDALHPDPRFEDLVRRIGLPP